MSMRDFFDGDMGLSDRLEAEQGDSIKAFRIEEAIRRSEPLFPNTDQLMDIEEQINALRNETDRRILFNLLRAHTHG